MLLWFTWDWRQSWKDFNQVSGRFNQFYRCCRLDNSSFLHGQLGSNRFSKQTVKISSSLVNKHIFRPDAPLWSQLWEVKISAVFSLAVNPQAGSGCEEKRFEIYLRLPTRAFNKLPRSHGCGRERLHKCNLSHNQFEAGISMNLHFISTSTQPIRPEVNTFSANRPTVWLTSVEHPPVCSFTLSLPQHALIAKLFRPTPRVGEQIEVWVAQYLQKKTFSLPNYNFSSDSAENSNQTRFESTLWSPFFADYEKLWFNWRCERNF